MIDEKPFLSVIMPVYNGENVIKDAVDSILKQSFKNLELIIVDDCSKDSTRQIVEEIVFDDARVRIISQNTNQGPGVAKNRGMAEARGEYVTFCDCDDWIEPNMYEDLCETVKSKGIDSVICGYSQDVIDTLTRTLRVQKCVFMKSASLFGRQKVIEYIPDIDAKRLFSFAWNKLYKKSLISNHNISFSDKMFGEDYEFNIKYFQHVNSVVIRDVCYYHYMKCNKSSLTERYIADFYENICNRYHDMRALLIQNECFTGRVRAISATVHIKHIVAALVRYCSPEACMTFKDRYAVTKEILNDTYTQEVRKYAKADTIQGRLCNGICKSKNILLNMIFARMLYMIQNHGAILFDKLK